MQDPRYKKLRQSLDLLRLPEHLNPDSVDLVQKLLNQHTRLLDIYNKLKKKASSQQTKIDVTNYEHQIDLLNQRNGQLKEQNQRLKRKGDQSGIDQKIMGLETALNNCRVKYEKKVDELTEKISTYEFQIEELNIAKTSLTDENQRIRSIFEKSKNQSENISAQLSLLLEKKKKQIQKLEEDNSKYRLQINSLERIYNQEKTSKSYSEMENDRKSSLALQVLKQEVCQMQQKLSQTREQLQQQRKKSQQLRLTIKSQSDKLSQLRCQQDYAKSSYSIESSAKQKYQQLYNESQTKLNDLKQKLLITESSKADHLLEIQRANQKIKDVISKNKILMANVNKMQEELAVLNASYTAKVRELREAENLRVGMDRKVRELEEQVKGYQDKQDRDGGFFDGANNMSQEYEKKLIILEKQIQLTQNELKIQQQSQHKALSQKSRLQTEVKKLQLIISEGNKQIQLIQLQKQSLLKQNKQIKSHLSSTQTETYSNKSQSLRLKETVDQYQIMIQQLRVALRNQQNTSKSFAHKANQLEKAVEKHIESNKEIFQDNKQLRLMVASLEKVKADLFEKYKISNEEKASKDDDRIQYIKQYNKLMDQNKQHLEKLRKKQFALSELSNEYDILQNSLDDKTMENAGLLDTIKKLEKELASYDRGLGERQMNLQGQQNHIRNLERQMQKVQNMYNNKCEQMNDCQMALNRSTLDCQTINNQLTLLIKTTKQSQKCLQREKLRQSDLQRKLKDRIKQVDELRQYSSMTKIENEQLITEIQKCKQEMTNLENYSNQVVQEYNNLYNVFKQKEIQIRELEEAVQAMRFKESQYVSQITHYEKQLRGLGEDLAKRDEEIRRIATDRDVYRAEVNTSRRSYSATNSTDWKIVYEEKINLLQHEISLKKRECEDYKVKMKSYQKIIETERQKNFYLEEQLKKSKVNDSQTPIKMFYKSRVESENWERCNTDSDRSCSQFSRESDLKINTNRSDQFLKRSGAGGESFETEKISVSSKQFLDNLTRQYNKTHITQEKR